MILLYVSVQKKGPGSQGRAAGAPGMAKSSAVCSALMVLCDLQTLALATPSEKCSDLEGLQSRYCSWSKEPWRVLASGLAEVLGAACEILSSWALMPRPACLPLGTEGSGRAEDQA